jgi:O-antigen ligase
MGTLTAGVLALAGLAIAPGLLFYYDVTPKIAIMLVGAAAALPWLGLRARLAGRFPTLLLAFWVSLAVSTMLSAYPDLSVGGSNWRRLGLVTWTAILIVAYACSQLDARGVRRVLRLIALSGSAAALYGILQYFAFDPWLAPESYRIGEGNWIIVRPPGTLGYVTYFATYLIGVAFAGAALLAEPARIWRIAGAFSAASAAAAIVLSGTRAAIAGLAAGTLVLFLALRPRPGRRVWAGALIAAAVALAFYYSPAGQQLRSRARWYIEDPAGGARLWLWRDTLALVRDHWAGGMGPESFTRQFPQYQSAELARRFPDFYHESPHNIFLEVLAAQGAPGLIVLLIAIAVAARAGRRGHSRGGIVTTPLLAWLAASIAAQQFSSFTAPTALFFFACLGLLAASGEERPSLPKRRPLAAALAVPLSAVLVVFAVRLLVADRMLASAQSALARNRAGEAIERYETSRRWAPAGFSADLWYARALASAAQNANSNDDRHRAWQAATVAAARAVHSADDPQNAWYNLAVFFGIQNDGARAEQALRRAMDAAPNWYKPRWMLAQLLRHSGRIEEASAEAARAADLNGGKTPEVLRTAEQARAEASPLR